MTNVWRMVNPASRSVAVVIVAALLLASSAAGVVAGPVRPLRAAGQPLLGNARAARAPVVLFRAAPSQTHFGPVLPAPFRALPLVSAPAPIKLLPALLPRIGLAALAPSSMDDCAATRSGVLIAALPAPAFAPLACRQRPETADGSVPATSLAAGRNKDALYGRAYSPHDFDAP
jgi:hypothetical protein